ncbi:MAG: hypothetical protein E5299_00880 [Burkholderia gladioli]|nr:MAG: hypothetical protein E5299_00880 [Burkholderia gladioli]
MLGQWRCCINLVRAGDVYAQRSWRTRCYQVRFRRTFPIFFKKTRRETRKTCEPKARYRVRNWAAYNGALINLENLTIWIDEAVLARILEAIPRRGRLRLYSGALIYALLGVKTVYRLTLRARSVSSGFDGFDPP